MAFYLSLAAAVMSAISLVLHAIAPKYPMAGTIADDVDAVEKLVPKA